MKTSSRKSKNIRVLVVDDHPIVRDGLVARIEKQEDLKVCGEAEDSAQAIQLIKEEKPDVAVIDISLNSGSGIDLIKQITAQFPKVRSVVLSMHDEKLYAERAMRAGAMGYVEKEHSAGKILDAIRLAYQGKVCFSDSITQTMLKRAMRGQAPEHSPIENLSDRELEVYELIGAGCDTRKIAEKLGLSTKTIETYRDRIRAKLDLKTAAELSRHAIQRFLEKR